MYNLTVLRYSGTNNDERTAMTIFMNLDTLPAGTNLYTLYVTRDPVGTPRMEMQADEVDVTFAPRSVPDAGVFGPANYGKVHPTGEHVPSYLIDDYGDAVRVVGIVDQSSGYTTYDAFATGAELTEDDER